MTSWSGPSSRRSSKARGLLRTSCGGAVERGRLLLRPLPMRERAARKFQRRWLGEGGCSETPLTHSLLRSAAAGLSPTGRGHNHEVNMNPIRRLAIAAAALSFWCFALFGATTPANAQANSQDWPSRPVKFIVPLGPGSGTDIGARLVAEQLTRLWGQPVLVENRAGGDAIVGINAFITAHDNHTLLYMPTSSFVAHPYLHDKLPYDPAELSPVARVSNTYVGLVVSPSLNGSTVGDFIAAARAQPGQLNYATGTGMTDVQFEAYFKREGLALTRVQYRD